MPTIENWSPQSSASHPRQHGSPGALDSGSRRMYSSTNNLIQSPESSASFITFRRGGSLTNSQRAASQHSQQQVAPTSIVQHTVVPNMQSSSSAVRGSSTSSGKLLHGDGSVSSVDTVEMVQVLLQSSLQVGGNGAVRFSPIVAAETSNSGLHPLSGSLEAPMAPLYSSTPTASNIQQSPWTVLTTSGSVIAPKGKLHSDEQYRCVDNDNDDLVVYRGMILLGWLQVLKLLGTGTFGQVFLCRDLRQLHPFHPPEEDVANSYFGESSSINSANSLRTARRLAASAQGAADTSHQPDWGGEDFQYFQCAGTFLPDGDLKQWPQSPRLVAVKVVKAIPSYELQSTLEAEILVRASEASIASGHSPNLHMSHPLCHLDGVNLTSTVNTSSSYPSPGGTYDEDDDDAQTSKLRKDTPSHGGIAEIYAHGFSFGHHCIVMQWYGENVYEYMKRQQPPPQLLPGTNQYAPACHGLHVERIRVLGRQLLEAIQILHEQLDVCHADVKPENIMLEVPDALRAEGYTPAEERILIEEDRLRNAAALWASPTTTTTVGGPFHTNFSSFQVSEPQTPMGAFGSVVHSPLFATYGNDVPSGASAISTALAAAASLRLGDTHRVMPANRMASRLVDLGSAFASNRPMFPYIQSRYYRAPEVIVGAPYGKPIDIWSAGCVLAEMLLGLPLLPGLDNFHQLCRITEMFGPLPLLTLSQGKDTSQFYRWVPENLCVTPAPGGVSSASSPSSGGESEIPAHAQPTVLGIFELKSEQEYYTDKLGPDAVPPAWKHYFQFKRLHQLVQNGALSAEERAEATLATGQPNLEILKAIGQRRKQLYDVLVLMLQCDPAKRITAKGALQMPFFATPQ